MLQIKKIWVPLLLLLSLRISDVQAQSFLYSLEDSLSADELLNLFRGEGILEVSNAHVGMVGPRGRGSFDAQGQPNDLNLDRGLILSMYPVITDSSNMDHGYPYHRGLGYPIMPGSDLSGTLLYPTDYEDPTEEMPAYDSNIVRLLDAFPQPPYYLSIGGHHFRHNRQRMSLKFDFVPAGDSISFRYVFLVGDNLSGSNGFTMFTAFLTGPESDTARNIAFVPGTAGTIVTTNTINSKPPTDPNFCTVLDPLAPYAEYMVDNNLLLSDHIPFITFSTVLEAKAAVIPCQPYSITITLSTAGLQGAALALDAESFRSYGTMGACAEDTTTSVESSLRQEEFCLVYPNPYLDEGVQLRLTGPGMSAQTYAVSVLDVSGRLVWHQEDVLSVLNTELQQVSASWPSGVYWIQVVDVAQHREQTLKLVKE